MSMDRLGKWCSQQSATNVTPHVLRHTMATRMVENNSDLVSVQKILGHNNINTTMTYVHATLESARADHLKAIV